MTNIYGYGKAFSSMYSGSLVGQGALAFAIWGYVISNQAPIEQFVSVDLNKVGGGEGALAVELNPKILNVIIGETTEDEVAGEIAKMCEPDVESRTPDEKGRRLVKIGQFAYWVVNGRKYRDLRIGELKREQNRLAQQRHRNKDNGKLVPKGIEQAMKDAKEDGPRRKKRETPLPF